jgi:mycothiol synthase
MKVILTSRLYTHRTDLQKMIDLIISSRPPARLNNYPSIVDLHEILASSAIQANTRLWEGEEDEAGKYLAAFAIVDTQFENLSFEVLPQARNPDIYAEIMAWGTECIKNGNKKNLYTGCYADDEARLALLEQHDFMPQATQTLDLSRPLHDPIPEPHLPRGFMIRPVAGEAEVNDLVNLHQAAHGNQNMTVESRLAMMRVPGYKPELDLVVVAPEGTLAAYCMGWISEEENRLSDCNEGHTDPVTTHPDFQRRGLARALLLRGCYLLRERGMDTASLSTGSENIAMQQVARSVGFHIVSAKTWFKKQISDPV